MDAEKDQTNQLEIVGKPLPQDIVEFIQKARDDLKVYEEYKSFYEKKRKREIILELVDLLVKYDYPKGLFRLIVARELGDYIGTRYIEIVLAEKYPNEKKKVRKQSTSQIAKISQIDDKTPIELSTTGESIVNDVDNELRNPKLYNTDHTSAEVSTEPRTELVQTSRGWSTRNGQEVAREGQTPRDKVLPVRSTSTRKNNVGKEV